MKTSIGLAALVAGAVVAAPALATTVSAVAVPGMLSGGTIADDVAIDFLGLGPSDGKSGVFTIDGVDMDLGNDSRETMDVSIDGIGFGRWVCDASPTSPSLAIPGASGANACDFSLSLTIGGGTLASILGDGSASVLLSFGSFVNVNPTSQLTVTLSYTNMAPIPLPASGLLLVAGLAGVAALRRRSRAA